LTKHVFSTELLSALCDLARSADELVDLVLDSKPYGSVMRELILDLNHIDNEKTGDLAEIAGDLTERQLNRVEIRNGDIWLEFEDEEEACPAKP
jgi:hypothetical protein